MSNVIEVDTQTRFDASQWIGTGRIYKDVPTQVSDAFTAARRIPPVLAATLPGPNISVRDFLAVQLPGTFSLENVSRNTSDWFSTDLPNCDGTSKLWALSSIPPISFLRELENDLPQQWLNGTKSILNPFNNSTRLPLFTLSFYFKIHELQEAQTEWADGMDWAKNEGGDSLEIFGMAGWNTVHSRAPDGQRDWIRLISNELISGDIVDGMVEDLQSQLAEIPALDAAVILAPLAFQRAIIAISTSKNPSKYNVQLLEKYKELIKAGKMRLYFPLHVDGNHWIAFIINFEGNFFGYGDSLGRKNSAAAFSPHLQKWLKQSFPGKFRNLGDILPHARQRDWIHCAIYTENTFGHAFFKQPLIASSKECLPRRMAWFRKFVAKAALAATAPPVPLFLNHNFPELGVENFFEDESPPPQAVTFPSEPELNFVQDPPEHAVIMTEVKVTAKVNNSVQSAPTSLSISPEGRPVSPLNVPVPIVPKSIPESADVDSKGGRKRKFYLSAPAKHDDSSDAEDSADERDRSKVRRAKELQPRKPKMSEDERRIALEQDQYTVKLASGRLKGSTSEVYCMCRVKAVKLDGAKNYNLKNWSSHQTICPLVTGIQPGARTKTVKVGVVKKSTGAGISKFFPTMLKKAFSTSSPTPAVSQIFMSSSPAAQTRKVVAADTRLSSYFSGAGNWLPRIAPPEVSRKPTECLGLHGEDYSTYVWQKGTSYIGGVSATDYLRIARNLFPYKNWNNTSSDSGDSDSELDPTELNVRHSDVMPEKAVVEACALTDAVKLAMQGMTQDTNTHTRRGQWTEYEKKRLHQSQVVAARWFTQTATGSVFAKDCHGTTANLSGTCGACTSIAKLEGLKRVIRRACAIARLPPDQFAAKMERKLKFTPQILSDNTAADVKTALSNPAVVKILSSKAMHGPGGAFLALYQQAQAGDLDDKESFLAICDQFTDKIRREQDPTGRLMKGIRYSHELGQLAALMRSHGPRSGAQYDLFRDMVGGISPRQLRRRITKSTMRMISSDLCPENIAPAVEFGKLMNWKGPWICAGDGTKLRPLLSVSTEYSEAKSAHVVGSTLPLSDVLFTSSQEQSRIISAVDNAKAIATQVWVLSLTIPLPNMPVFVVAMIPNKGTMKAQDYCDQHLKLRQLCADAGLKLLASAADGAKSEVNAQKLMMNVETKQRLSYANKTYGIDISCPVYEDTGPHIGCMDIEHSKKGVRNNFLSGTHLLILGILFLCHSVLMALLAFGLYIRDIFNPEKQDDGAARRLFLDGLFASLVDADGNIVDVTLEGFFVLSFIFGELFDAYMKRSMPHIERVTCIFRARHFLTIWRANVVRSEGRYMGEIVCGKFRQVGPKNRKSTSTFDILKLGQLPGFHLFFTYNFD